MKPALTYDTHRHQPVPTYVAGAAVVLALALLVAGWTSSLADFGLLALIVAVMALVSMSRVYIVRLQDRIILLEMKIRCAEILPAGADTQLAALSPKQVVALRFASDEELPGLLDRAVRDRLSPDEIKRAIQAWRPDHLRT